MDGTVPFSVWVPAVRDLSGEVHRSQLRGSRTEAFRELMEMCQDVGCPRSRYLYRYTHPKAGRYERVRVYEVFLDTVGNPHLVITQDLYAWWSREHFTLYATFSGLVLLLLMSLAVVAVHG